MPVQLMNCTLPKLMEGQKLTQGALQTPLRMPPQWTFYSDKFLIYFQMASEFLARLLSAVTPPRTGWVSWAVWVRLSPSGMARSAAPGFVSLLDSSGCVKGAGLAGWHQIPRLQEDGNTSSSGRKEGSVFRSVEYFSRGIIGKSTRDSSWNSQIPR